MSDVKRMLNLLDSKALNELRVIQKPDPEIEDIFATVIIICKFNVVFHEHHQSFITKEIVILLVPLN